MEVQLGNVIRGIPDAGGLVDDASVRRVLRNNRLSHLVVLEGLIREHDVVEDLLLNLLHRLLANNGSDGLLVLAVGGVQSGVRCRETRNALRLDRVAPPEGSNRGNAQSDRGSVVLQGLRDDAAVADDAVLTELILSVVLVALHEVGAIRDDHDLVGDEFFVSQSGSACQDGSTNETDRTSTRENGGGMLDDDSCNIVENRHDVLSEL